MAHLTDPEAIRKEVRPVSKHLEDSRIDIYIEEAEQLNIKPRVGDALYIDLVKYVGSMNKGAFPPEYGVLLNGGEYVRNGEEKTFVGLATALNYYVYAKLVKNNNETVTRGGFNEQNNQYSANADLKRQLVAEKDALSVADKYMSDCIDYLNSVSIPKFTTAGKAKNRLKIKIIGD